MEQLLNITRIPIKVEVKVQRPEFKQVENTGSSAPSIKVSAGQNGGLRLQAQPYKIDLSENRNFDTFVPSSGNDGGITLTYQAIAKLADGSNPGVKLSGDNSQHHFNTQRASRSIESVLQSLPKSKNSAVSYSDGTLSINYRISNSSAVENTKDIPEFEFIPGSIEFIISQMPQLDIEYLGDPIYFPRSADPNYEAPLDIFA